MKDQIHDALVKKVLGNPEHMAGELRLFARSITSPILEGYYTPLGSVALESVDDSTHRAVFSFPGVTLASGREFAGQRWERHWSALQPLVSVEQGQRLVCAGNRNRLLDNVAGRGDRRLGGGALRRRPIPGDPGSGTRTAAGGGFWRYVC